jgi:hypothetical protein
VSTSQSFPDAGLQNPGSQVSKSEGDIRTKGDHQIATRDEVEKVLGTDVSQGFHSVLPSILGIAPRKPVIEVNELLGRLELNTFAHRLQKASHCPSRCHIHFHIPRVFGILLMENFTLRNPAKEIIKTLK